MKKGFELLLQKIDKTEVLDVGGGGLDGENTSCFLIDRFGVDNVFHINIKPDSVKKFLEICPEAQMFYGDYYNFPFTQKFDIVVLDLNIESNLRDWENNHMRAWELVKPGGCIITYVMTTTDYGNEETKELLKTHQLKQWGTNDITHEIIRKNEYVEYVEQDSRRSTIQWVVLK